MKPVPGRFKDYIAMPKANMYQSLHTTVIGPGGKRIEVQIRTQERHHIAEQGIAAHWKYKEGKDIERKDDEQFAWLRQLLEWQQDLKDPREFLDTVNALNTLDLTHLLNDWLASVQIEGLSYKDAEPKIMAIAYELELRAQGGNQ